MRSTKSKHHTEKNSNQLAQQDTSNPTENLSIGALLQKALEAKKQKMPTQKTSKELDKGQKIGMPPRGTRRSMGKR